MAERGRIRRFFGWWVKGSWGVKIAKLLPALVVLYNIYTFTCGVLPPVHGTVVDMETGKPVAGAQVEMWGVYSFLLPVETADRIFAGGGSAVTDQKGRFAFSQSNVLAWGCGGEKGLNILWGIPLTLLIPKWPHTIRLVVYDPRYQTVNSEQRGLWWETQNGGIMKGTSLRRKRIPVWGYGYRIATSIPHGEPEWREKCESTLYATNNIPREITDAWIFADLSGYLDRWPEGENTRKYVLLLMDRMAMGDTPENLQDAIKRGVLKRNALKIQLERNRRIVGFAKRIGPPSPPFGVVVSFPDYEKRLEAVEACTMYLEQVVPEGGAR